MVFYVVVNQHFLWYEIDDHLVRGKTLLVVVPAKHFLAHTILFAIVWLID